MIMITITDQEFQDLLEDRKLLKCLQNAGVDNWPGYDVALEEFNKKEKA